MLFLRPNERGERLSDRTRGIAVFGPDGSRYFVPGWSPEHTMVAVRETFPESVLTHPDTQIEFGTANGRDWTPAKVLKARAVSDATNEQ